jgi:hypothetical protein
MILKLASTALVAGFIASTASLAHAAPPPEATMLVPGVYTTPEITAACQAYAAKRVGTSSNTDSARQSVALACAKKMWAKKYGTKKAKR